MNRLNQVGMKQTEANARFDNNLGVGSLLSQCAECERPVHHRSRRRYSFRLVFPYTSTTPCRSSPSYALVCLCIVAFCMLSAYVGSHKAWDYRIKLMESGKVQSRPR